MINPHTMPPAECASIPARASVRLTEAEGHDRVGVWAGEDPAARRIGVDLWDGKTLLTEGEQLPLWEWWGEGDS